MKTNPYPVSSHTAERQGGGQTPPTAGEKHGQAKARQIPAEKRYSGAENASLVDSPGRASADARDKQS